MENALLDLGNGDKLILEDIRVSHLDPAQHRFRHGDVGDNAHVGKTWEYDLTPDALTMLAQHDPALVSGPAR